MVQHDDNNDTGKFFKLFRIWFDRLRTDSFVVKINLSSELAGLQSA